MYRRNLHKILLLLISEYRAFQHAFSDPYIFFFAIPYLYIQVHVYVCIVVYWNNMHATEVKPISTPCGKAESDDTYLVSLNSMSLSATRIHISHYIVHTVHC